MPRAVINQGIGRKIKKDPYKICQDVYFSALETQGNEFCLKT